MASKFLDDNGLLYFYSKLKAKFVAKDGAKVLSDNNYTTTEKNKLTSIADNANNYILPTASPSVKGGVKVDGSTIVMTGEVISATGGVTFSRVASLPGTGSVGIIYLLAVTGSAQNVYDEYIWCDTTGTGTMGYEKIGTTAIDLSGYWAKADLAAVTNAEIDTITAT